MLVLALCLVVAVAILSLMIVQYIMYFQFCGLSHVMFAHNRPGKGEASMPCPESDSPGDSTGNEV